ncbi:hypothetical protein, partial [Helicobacter rodentium]|uniref:hypothetical protein n=1 Tax=Helicobacter rodentium TaxID=59617 RepID=UPI001B80B959
IARKFEKFSWQSIMWNLICKASIVKFFFMLDYRLLRHSLCSFLAMTENLLSRHCENRNAIRGNLSSSKIRFNNGIFKRLKL